MSRILIVEDEQSVSRMLEEFLVERGHEVVMATDGQQAVETVTSTRPDLIIMDLMLPRLTGGEAARMLRHQPATRGIPILAISGSSHVADVADMLQVDSILTKPFDLDDLDAEIMSLLVPEFDNYTQY